MQTSSNTHCTALLIIMIPQTIMLSCLGDQSLNVLFHVCPAILFIVFPSPYCLVMLSAWSNVLAGTGTIHCHNSMLHLLGFSNICKDLSTASPNTCKSGLVHYLSPRFLTAVTVHLVSKGNKFAFLQLQPLTYRQSVWCPLFLFLYLMSCSFTSIQLLLGLWHESCIN